MRPFRQNEEKEVLFSVKIGKKGSIKLEKKASLSELLLLEIFTPCQSPAAEASG